MLYVFFGNNTTGVRQKALSRTEELASSGTEVIKITPDIYKTGMITELSQATGLFSAEQVIVLDTPSDEADVESEIIEDLALMQNSPNHFILIEKQRNAIQKKLLTKYATHIEEVQTEKGQQFNAFALTDALLRRDKKSFWLLLTEALRAGLTHEEIIGVLYWQLKTLRLIQRSNSPEESGQKPFVYQKAKRALALFKTGEIDELARSLLKIYHDGHLGRIDIGSELERWVLKV